MTGIPTLELNAAARDEVEAHAKDAWPEECCGLLIGHRSAKDSLHLIRVMRSANMAPVEERRRRFVIDPALHLVVQRQSRERGEIVIGVYHSHPDGDALPSASDRAQALTGDYVWLIAAMKGAAIDDMQAYWRAGTKMPALFLSMPMKLSS